MKVVKYTFPLIFASLGFLIYSNVLHSPFIFDDVWFIVNNSQIRDIPSFLKDFSGTRYIGFLSFAVNYYFGGLNTFGYHLVNIIIHIINAILVYVLVSLTFKALPLTSILSPEGRGNGEGELQTQSLIAFSVSLIFLVHPIQTQAVSYLTQRFTSLATLFYLSALILYIKARLKIQGSRLNLADCNLYLASIFSAVLAMKTKELSFTLPFIIILYEWTFFREELPLPSGTGFQPVETGKMPVPPESGRARGKRFLYLLPFVLTLIIIPLDLFFTHTNSTAERGLQDTLQGEMTTNPLIYYNSILTQFNVMLTYIRLLFIPVHQNLWYDYPLAHSIFEVQTFLSLFLLILIFIGTIYLYFRARKANNVYGLLISFGIFWFFITLSIVSAMPLSGVIFEHWLYLPSIGFILSITTAVAYVFNYLEKKAEKSLIYYFVSVIFIITASFSFSAYQRNIIWSDDYMMWLDTVNKSPNKAGSRNNLGNIYTGGGLFEEALKEYKLVLEVNPDYYIGHYNLGNLYAKKGMWDEAISAYRQALKIFPNYTSAHHNLGIVYYNKDMIDDAIGEFKKAIEIQPNYSKSYYSLANIYHGKGLLQDAIELYQKLLKIYPKSAWAHNKLGAVYYKNGQLDDAIQEFKKCLEIKPDYSDGYNSLGAVYYKKEQIDDAIKEFQEAVRLSPINPNAYFNLFNVFAKKKDKEQTLKYYNKFIEQATDKSFEPSIIKAKKILQELQYE